MSINVVGNGQRLFCVVCRLLLPAEAMDTDFGADAWGRRYGAGICSLCAVPATSPVTEEDEMVEEIRG